MNPPEPSKNPELQTHKLALIQQYSQLNKKGTGDIKFVVAKLGS